MTRSFTAAAVWCLVAVATSLFGFSSFEAVPWTRNFLEVRPTYSLEYLSVSKIHHTSTLPHHCYRNRWQGTLSICAAPYPDWELALCASGASVETGKIAMRMERQFLSDLRGDACALSMVVKGAVMDQRRARQPVFCEMAPLGAAAGVGVGRHVWIRPEAYTQLFSYVLAGVGTYSSRWMSVELGIQHVLSTKHFFRCGLAQTKSFGDKGRRFHGFGSVHANATSGHLSYTYRCADGIETSISYVIRLIQGGGARRAQSLQIRWSLPISL